MDLICVSTFLYMVNKLSRQGIRNRETVMYSCIVGMLILSKYSNSSAKKSPSLNESLSTRRELIAHLYVGTLETYLWHRSNLPFEPRVSLS